MANPEHVEIVKQGVEIIAKWREDNPDYELDLSDADFSHAKLSGAKLDGANFNGSILNQAKLIGADLSDATFENAQMSQVNLTRAYLFEADLYGAKLCNAFLGSADLSNADMTGADLRRVNLSNADLENTNLSTANMSGADLTRTILYNTCLNKTKLCGANLTNAKLTNVDLIGTNFDKVDVSYSHFNNLDLSRALNLESVTHQGPSSVGVDTLLRSGGKIPKMFLRGCGLPDNFISEITNSVKSYNPCFINFSHHDSAFAQRIHDALQSRGIRCWLDGHQSTDNEINVRNKMLICASSSSLTSDWFNDELDFAFTNEKHFKKLGYGDVLVLVPLSLDSYLNSDWKHPKRKKIIERLAADFTGWEKDNAIFEEQLERVVKALQTDNSGREPDPQPKL